ncbi:arsenosugar biosynthesis radical SAM (seleno)protein ArsS [Candidatus Uabimicrobium sp. HlEnr_7]|uniref:arsenosugar biosynthesis radical SAM (seleno)protein ArsS n=1 Tax=Candidatus Uabimicrobium helgolandensis TaxID=3095367 RepID=UPI003556D822
MKIASQPFSEMLAKNKIALEREDITTLQVNIGKYCNMACLHCHVEAGPKRTEIMELRTVDQLLKLIEKTPTIKLVDITGGAPELNPHFKYFVSKIRSMNRQVMDRCNLTVLFVEGQEQTAQFLADHGVQITASLPCYSQDNVDEQRGKGAFNQSIKALHLLNKLGYGRDDSDLVLNLVYNPVEAHLPPDQAQLERDYKKRLWQDLGITFNHLFTITNMPIKRYLHFLEREGQLADYMELLVNSFNIQAAASVMCRHLVSVSWDGEIFDCDFNQMLEIPVGGKKATIWDVSDFKQFKQKSIAIADHCYGCTAGAGSSCSGSLDK